MKKTLIVAAVASLAAGSAFAQSSVNITGRFNVTLEQQDINGTKLKKMEDNASRITFKGIEDLGGGLKAGFVLEHGFRVDQGSAASSSFWGRQSEVNLAGGFGMVRLGNFTSEAYYATSDYIGLHNHETGTSSDALYAYIGRNTNKIAYRTPEFIKGLTAEVAVSAAEGPRTRTWDLAVNYGSGPLHVGFGYEKAGNANQYAASVLYEAGALIFGAMIQRDEDGYGANLGTRTNYRGSVAYIAGQSEFHFNVGKAGDYSKVADSDATQFTLGYNYNLSKRTKVYGYYTDINASRRTPYATDFSSFAVGVRHNF
jgi:predicted porin